MPDQPLFPNRHEDVAIATIVVEPDLGEDREVGLDPGRRWCELNESHVGNVVSHDPLHSGARGGTGGGADPAEEVDDRLAAGHRIAASDLEHAVRTEGQRELAEAQGVTGPRVAGNRVADPFPRDNLPGLHEVTP